PRSHLYRFPAHPAVTMNILIIHNSYQQPGGEDVVVDQETRLLERNGHKVSVYKRSNDEIDHLSFGQRLGLISRMVSAGDTKDAVRRLLRDFNPDVVHVHNTFLMVSPSVYEVCQEEGVPVVQTLHNYRLLCPASTLYRENEPCEECVTHTLLRSVRRGCYRDSRLMSAAIALMLQTHRSRQTWERQIDAYVAISSFVREKFVQTGLPAGKISVKPNFVDPDPGERSDHGDYALFVGRLSPEKGLLTLLQAWERLPSAVPVVIAGDGPMRPQLEAEVARKRLSRVHFAGRLRRQEAYDAIKKAAFLVVPSIWYEPFGLVVAEGFACGTPVLGASVGGIEEMLEDQVTGLHFTPGDPEELAKKVAWAWTHATELAEMGKAARRVYEDRYTANTNYDLLMRIYDSAIESHARFKPNRSHRAAA
ncbi:MAG TPA: glycosyltransferase, partial [Terriglobales bacterium]|nr:glycosyltransferase [Terriglobales bacterium]